MRAKFSMKIESDLILSKVSEQKQFLSKVCPILISSGSIIMCLSLPEILFVQTYLQTKKSPNLRRQNLAGAIKVSHLNRPGVQNINVPVCRR